MRFVILFGLLSFLGLSLVFAHENSGKNLPSIRKHVGTTVKPEVRVKRGLGYGGPFGGPFVRPYGGYYWPNSYYYGNPYFGDRGRPYYGFFRF